jgi:hypothetical protein
MSSRLPFRQEGSLQSIALWVNTSKIPREKLGRTDSDNKHFITKIESPKLFILLLFLTNKKNSRTI